MRFANSRRQIHPVRRCIVHDFHTEQYISWYPLPPRSTCPQVPVAEDKLCRKRFNATTICCKWLGNLQHARGACRGLLLWAGGGKPHVVSITSPSERRTTRSCHRSTGRSNERPSNDFQGVYMPVRAYSHVFFPHV